MADVDREIARIAERQHGVLSKARLRSLGLSDRQIEHRIADRRLHPIHRSVYSVGHSVVSRRGRWLAAVIAAGPGALLSHRDGAALLDLRHVHDGRIDVTITGASRRHAGIRIHRTRILHPEDRTIAGGIPVTSPARTLLDLAEVGTPTQLRRAYERAHRNGLLDTVAIQRLLARSNGRRGVKPLGSLLDYDATEAARASSELESLFFDLVRAASLPSPALNAVVDGYEVDAYWREADLVVELDGYEFHSGRSEFERDHEKLARLRLAGHEVLALTYRQVTDEAQWVTAALRQLLAPSVI